MTTYNIFNHATETGAGQVQSDQQIQLGVIFTPLISGTITKIYFWKDATDTSTTRVVAIYDPIGLTNLTGNISSSSEPTGSGQWVSVPITPFAVVANTPYAAVVHFPFATGAYSATGAYFASADKSSVGLKAYSSAHAVTATGGAGNGRFTYFNNVAFPEDTAFTDQSFNDTNYWIDIELTTAGTTLVLGDKVLDNGLNYLDTNCDKIFVCSQMPTSYADATSTSALGNYNWGAGNAFPADGAKSGGGRQISSNAITNGSITANGTVAAWAAVDTANSLLLASGALTGGGAVLSGQTFSLGVLTIGIPNH